MPSDLKKTHAPRCFKVLAHAEKFCSKNIKLLKKTTGNQFSHSYN